MVFYRPICLPRPRSPEVQKVEPDSALLDGVLDVVEDADEPVDVQVVRNQLREWGEEEIGEAVRTLVSRGCILVTRDWELVARPGHAEAH